MKSSRISPDSMSGEEIAKFLLGPLEYTQPDDLGFDSKSPASSVSPNPAVFVPPFNPSSGTVGTSVDPGDMDSGGGGRGNFTLKKHAHKSQNRSKSNNRKTTTTRKNLKFKRVIKKHITKYKTYKRKAKGRKLRGNKYKNNKTMRRMRCVRK